LPNPFENYVHFKNTPALWGSLFINPVSFLHTTIQSAFSQNLFIAMSPFEILLFPTVLFSEKRITSITQRKIKFVEVQQNMSSA